MSIIIANVGGKLNLSPLFHFSSNTLQGFSMLILCKTCLHQLCPSKIGHKWCPYLLTFTPNIQTLTSDLKWSNTPRSQFGCSQIHRSIKDSRASQCKPSALNSTKPDSIERKKYEFSNFQIWNIIGRVKVMKPWFIWILN